MSCCTRCSAASRCSSRRPPRTRRTHSTTSRTNTPAKALALSIKSATVLYVPSRVFIYLSGLVIVLARRRGRLVLAVRRLAALAVALAVVDRPDRPGGLQRFDAVGGHLRISASLRRGTVRSPTAWQDRPGSADRRRDCIRPPRIWHCRRYRRWARSRCPTPTRKRLPKRCPPTGRSLCRTQRRR